MKKIRIIAYHVFNNGESFSVDIDRVINHDDLETLRQVLEKKHGVKNVYFTYREVE